MKPKTKIQILIAELSNKLHAVTEKQQKWGYDKCFNHMGFRTKLNTTCMECGTQFNTADAKCQCPNCDTKLTIIDTKKRKGTDAEYMTILTTVNEYQVIRFVEVRQYYNKGEIARYFSSEIVQHWIDKSGTSHVLSRLQANSFGYGAYSWSWSSDMELRKSKFHYNISSSHVYPTKKYLPEILRNGFKGQYHGLSKLDMFTQILSNNKLETLLKAKQHEFVKYFAGRGLYWINENWNSIKICIRNNYFPKDAGLWSDYIELLKHFNNDVLNKHYVCPQNLKAEHDKLDHKKKVADEIQRQNNQILQAENKRIKHEENLRVFNEFKSNFFGIEFSNNLIQIKVLDTLDEYQIEGERLNHCVFSNEYFGRPDSLILSARINNQPIETIEFSLEKMEVVQCRGYNNQNTEYHNQIIELVNKNSKLIKKRMPRKMAA